MTLYDMREDFFRVTENLGQCRKQILKRILTREDIERLVPLKKYAFNPLEPSETFLHYTVTHWKFRIYDILSKLLEKDRRLDLKEVLPVYNFYILFDTGLEGIKIRLARETRLKAFKVYLTKEQWLKGKETKGILDTYFNKSFGTQELTGLSSLVPLLSAEGKKTDNAFSLSVWRSWPNAPIYDETKYSEDVLSRELENYEIKGDNQKDCSELIVFFYKGIEIIWVTKDVFSDIFLEYYSEIESEIHDFLKFLEFYRGNLLYDQHHWIYLNKKTESRQARVFLRCFDEARKKPSYLEDLNSRIKKNYGRLSPEFELFLLDEDWLHKNEYLEMVRLNDARLDPSDRMDRDELSALVKSQESIKTGDEELFLARSSDTKLREEVERFFTDHRSIMEMVDHGVKHSENMDILYTRCRKACDQKTPADSCIDAIMIHDLGMGEYTSKALEVIRKRVKDDATKTTRRFHPLLSVDAIEKEEINLNDENAESRNALLVLIGSHSRKMRLLRRQKRSKKNQYFTLEEILNACGDQVPVAESFEESADNLGKRELWGSLFLLRMLDALDVQNNRLIRHNVIKVMRELEPAASGKWKPILRECPMHYLKHQAFSRTSVRIKDQPSGTVSMMYFPDIHTNALIVFHGILSAVEDISNELRSFDAIEDKKLLLGDQDHLGPFSSIDETLVCRVSFWGFNIFKEMGYTEFFRKVI